MYEIENTSELFRRELFRSPNIKWSSVIFSISEYKLLHLSYCIQTTASKLLHTSCCIQAAPSKLLACMLESRALTHRSIQVCNWSDIVNTSGQLLISKSVPSRAAIPG